jgi:hypothetical protein
MDFLLMSLFRRACSVLHGEPGAAQGTEHSYCLFTIICSVRLKICLG